MSDKCKVKGCYEAATCRDGCCVQCTKGQKSKRAYHCRTYPRTLEPHIGVEVECYATTELGFRGIMAQRETGHSDGSLPNWGCEFKVCKPAKVICNWVLPMLDRLKNVGARVNKKCGFHVHLDMRGVSRERKHKAIQWLRNHQDFFFTMAPLSRRGRGPCLPMCGDQGGGHHTWAHISDYETIEIRLHPGTLNRFKAQGWLCAMIDLMTMFRDEERVLPYRIIEDDGEGVLVDEGWFERVFTNPIGAEYIQTRLDKNGSMETWEGGINTCAD